jgi:putative glutamine amidotransferase
MPYPLIGITSYRQNNERGLPVLSLNEAYVRAVSEAGGLPIIIPLGIDNTKIKKLIQGLDGVLFSGGGDVSPDLYGTESQPEVKSIDLDRDRVEIQLVHEVVERGLPFFGICRGIQIINVALGGTLYPHIPDQLVGAINHPYIEGKPRDYLAHDVTVEPNACLAKILEQPRIKVNSMHHQGILSLASRLVATAHAPDGLVEGVELKGKQFGLAVQWHPECLTQYEPMRALFRTFVEAATR